MKLLTIIVPFYNVEPYFEQCINSLVDINCQDKYQILLIDDCGNDNSINIANEYAEKYPALIQVITHSQNSGLSAARNTGIKHAQSDYIMFIDSDDWLSDNCIEVIISEIQQYKPDLMFFDFIREWPNRSEKVTFNNESSDTLLLKSYHQHKMLAKMPVTAWGKVFKTTIFQPYIFPVGALFEDVAVIPAVVHECEKIIYSPSFTYRYRQREGSIMDGQRGEPSILFNAYSLLCNHKTLSNTIDLEFVTVKDLFINVRVAYREGKLEKALSLLDIGNSWLTNNYPKWQKNNYILTEYGSPKWYLRIKAPLLLHLLKFQWGRKLFLQQLNHESISIKKLFN
jgi:glycosyltransferase involved in cell wall biosynthesis